VLLGFTDAASLPGGGWAHSAAAEQRHGSVAGDPDLPSWLLTARW